MKGGWTHKGWFYILPIYVKFDDQNSVMIEMRGLGWAWPITLCCAVHKFFNFISGEQLGFPLTSLRLINGEENTHKA